VLVITLFITQHAYQWQESRIFYLETKYCCEEGGDLGESLEVVGKKKGKRGESEVREVWRKSRMFWLLGRKKKIF
jgi:hypothetical protein